jgi:hypothetical protein
MITIRKPNGKPVVGTEYAECLLFVDYLDVLKRTGRIKEYTHIANETYTPSWAAKNRNKAQGVKPGFPDYLILIGTGKMLFVEMKRERGGVVSSEQKYWISLLQSCGFETAVCKGYKEAEDFVNKHIERPLVI